MMILAAVVLLVGFIALAGMVARVSQLASETTIESRHAVIDEVGPFADSLDQALCRLKASSTTARQVTDGVTAANSPTVTSATAAFSAADVGMTLAGTGIAPGTRIQAVNSATSATLTSAATSTLTGVTFRLSPCLAQGTTSSFSLSTSTTPTIEVAAIALLEHLQSMQAARGLFMDWRIQCGAGTDGIRGSADDTAAASQVVAHLWDGTIWVEVRSAITLPRSTPCAPVAGACVAPATAAIGAAEIARMGQCPILG